MLSQYKNPEILYPVIDFSDFDESSNLNTLLNQNSNPFFLSLNHYECKKNIKAFSYIFEKITR